MNLRIKLFKYFLKKALDYSPTNSIREKLRDFSAIIFDYLDTDTLGYFGYAENDRVNTTKGVGRIIQADPLKKDGYCFYVEMLSGEKMWFTDKPSICEIYLILGKVG